MNREENLTLPSDWQRPIDTLHILETQHFRAVWMLWNRLGVGDHLGYRTQLPASGF